MFGRIFLSRTHFLILSVFYHVMCVLCGIENDPAVASGLVMWQLSLKVVYFNNLLINGGVVSGIGYI